MAQSNTKPRTAAISAIAIVGFILAGVFVALYTQQQGVSSSQSTTISALNQSVSSLNTQVSGDSSSISSLQGEVASLQAQVSTLQQQNSTNQAAIAADEAEIASLQSQINSLEAARLVGTFPVSTSCPLFSNCSYSISGAYANTGTNIAYSATLTFDFYQNADGTGALLCTAAFNLGNVAGQSITTFSGTCSSSSSTAALSYVWVFVT